MDRITTLRWYQILVEKFEYSDFYNQKKISNFSYCVIYCPMTSPFDNIDMTYALSYDGCIQIHEDGKYLVLKDLIDLLIENKCFKLLPFLP